MHLPAVTDNAGAAAKDAEQRVAQLARRRAELARRYREELDAIDRLKMQRASWRHDRELRDSLSSSAETANELGKATRELEKANANLASARRAYLAAIEAERRTRVDPLRARELERVRAVLAPEVLTPRVNDLPRRIVFPDLDVDPLADPEELDQRAVELRASEDALARRLAGLEAQAAELDHLALLRKQHDRAGYLLDRDDDQPHRNTAQVPGNGGGASDDGASSGGSHLPGPGAPPPSAGGSASIVLSDVIDATTIGWSAAAPRAGDPAQRAQAAHQARDALATWLEQVRNKRIEIEARAKQLRSKR